MTYERSYLAGMTDYTGVSLNDISSHLKDWLMSTDQTIGDLRNYLEKAKAQSTLLENPREVISFIEHFIDLFSRYRDDIDRLLREISVAVTSAHIEIVQQLYQSSKQEEQWTIQFKQDWVYKRLPHEEMRPLLDNIYGETRNLLIDYCDFSNLVSRLRTFLTATAPASEALPDFHLKPNLFGIGLNLNRVLGRIHNWWRRRK